jgi:S-adenosylmethionine-dependent methyltransferase
VARPQRLRPARRVTSSPTFDDRAEWFDAHYGTTRGRIRRRLVLERLGETLPPPPARVLDAGGGTGVIAIPLAEQGYDVTLLDPSEGMLRVATERIQESGVELATVHGSIGDGPGLTQGTFDAICCHAVLMYVDDPGVSLSILRSIARDGAVLSLLEKNRDALAMRPGLRGDYEEALRVLDDPIATGNLGIRNRSRSVEEWRALLDAAGWRFDSAVGIRLFSDPADDHLTDDAFEQLLRLEREAGRRSPYRDIARLIHIAATAVSA